MISTNIFRVFVSSTFSDMTEERNALHERVFPQLWKLCASHGVRFQPIDLRWGISDEATHNQQTVAICLAEIERCQQMTRRPNFIVLLGDRYGWQPPPADILCGEFEIILTHSPNSVDQDLLNEWYRRDDNAVPPVYSLEPRTGTYTDSDTWMPIERHLRRILEAAAAHLPEDRRAKYLTSVTEQEIERGIFAVEDPTASTFCFFRTITDLPAYPDGRRYIDLDENDQLDTTAQARLHDLKQRLRDRLPDNIHEYEARWESGKVSTAHLDQLCEDVYERLATVIRSELETRQRYTNPWEDEFTAHLDFGQDRARSFVGRGDVIERIDAYLAQPTGKPLVVYGESGSGKTTVMGRMMQQVQADYPQAVLICRFIGVTPGSSDIRSLLESLCRQIQWRTGASVAIPTDYHELISTFATLLTQASAERPLIVLLDALDQLSTLNEAHKLGWLPVELPAHVRLICSTLPGDSLDVLREKLDSNSLVEVGPLSVADGRSLLLTWLSDVDRTLQSPQEAEVLHQFETNGRPLYLRLAFEEARLWKSDTPHPALNPDIPGIIRDNLFARLSEQANHGPLLVSHALAYLVAARNGLTEDELLDLLARDDEFWTDFTADAYWNPIGRQVPIVIWSRLYFDLRPYLTERAGDGTALLAFYHRQLREAVASCNLPDPIGALFRRQMAQYFGEQSLYLNRNGAQVPNQRKLSELPYQYFHGGQMQELCALLTDSPEWMEAQFAASNGHMAYTADLELAINGFADPLDADQALILARLYTARQVVHAQVSIYNDTDLKTLVWLGREQEALSHARLRGEPQEQFAGLMVIYEAQKHQNRAYMTPLDSLLPIALGIQEVHKRVEALCALATALAQTGDEQAADIFREAGEVARGIQEERRQTEALRVLVADLVQAGRYAEAGKVARGIQDEKIRVRALRDLTAALMQTGNYAEWGEVARDIQDVEIRAQALVTLAAALAQAGHYTKAAEVFREAGEAARRVQDAEIRAQALVTLAAALAEVGDGRAAEVFREAGEAARRIQDWDKQASALRDLVAALAQAGHYTKAGEVAREIQRRSRRASALCALATALAQTGDKQAAEVFREASETARDIQDEEIRTKALRDLVAALMQTGNYAEAGEVARDIQKEDKQTEALCELAAVLTQAGNRQAVDIFREAGEMARGIQNEEIRTKALCKLAAVLTRAGNRQAVDIFREAGEVARGIRWEYQRDGALRDLAAALTQAGRYSEAGEVARDIQDEEIRTKALRDLAAALAQAGRYSEAGEVARDIQNEKIRAESLRDLAAALAQVGDQRAANVSREAGEIARRIQEKEDRKNRERVLCDLAAAVARSGHYDKAKEVMFRIQDEAMRLEARRNLVVVLAQAGHYAEADRVARCSASLEGLALTLGDLASALAQVGHYAEASKVARNIPYDGSRTRVLCVLAVGMAQSGDERVLDVFHEASEVAHSIKQESERATALRDLAAALAQVGHYADADKLARSIQDGEIRAQALIALATALAQTGEKRGRSSNINTWLFKLSAVLVWTRKKRAADVFREVGKTARGVKTEAGQARVLRNLASALAQVGHYVEAGEVARSIQGAWIRGVALCDLAVVLAQAGHYVKAGEVARSIQDANIRAQALAALATALVEVDDGQAAEVFREAGEVASGIQMDWERATALRDLASALAQTRYFAEAFAALRKREPSEFVQEVAKWNKPFDILRPGLSVQILQEVLRIIGWERADWCEIHELLTAREPKTDVGSN